MAMTRQPVCPLTLPVPPGEFFVPWQSPRARGRDFRRGLFPESGTAKYHLERWNNSLVQISRNAVLEDPEHDKIRDQIRSFKYENRFNEAALKKLVEIASHFKLEALGFGV